MSSSQPPCLLHIAMKEVNLTLICSEAATARKKWIDDYPQKVLIIKKSIILSAHVIIRSSKYTRKKFIIKHFH